MPGTLIKDRGIIHGGPPPLAGDGGGGDPEGRGSSRRVSFTGLIVLLGAVLMFFAAFISAFIVRRGTSKDWVSLPLPHLVYWNTGVLLASSLVLESARRALRSGHRTAFNRLWTLGTLLGAAFLAGQAMVWQQLHAGRFLCRQQPEQLVLLCAHRRTCRTRFGWPGRPCLCGRAGTKAAVGSRETHHRRRQHRLLALPVRTLDFLDDPLCVLGINATSVRRWC